ncbi:uncharacterized protein LOC113770988 [Coffea eugenioides]|uniref:uncharacterized protein LOC113770988 n=1 Tax=Coffea eugenioides TaxID=49369 RepID=UPI000F60EB84|nr:uncharacterized protein LOC113770988 [Coffea eugenioides]
MERDFRNADSERGMDRFSGDLIFDTEVEKTARRTRKKTRQLREEHSSATSQRPESGVEPTDSFGDTSSEESYKHLQEFDVVCNSMKPLDITEEQIKIRAFPFSLKDSAKDWLYYLPPGSITTWDQLKKKDRSIIDAASGGALVNKTPQEARELIEGMAENSQQFSSREDIPIRKVNEVETSSMQQQLTELTSFVRQLAVGNASQARVCGICTGMGHSADMCPMLQEETAEQDIRNQISQMATTINRLESQVNGRLPSQPELNLKNVSAMTLRSGKEIQGPEPMIPKDKDEEKIENELEREDSNGADLKVLPDPIITVKTNPPPFPCRLEKSKKQDKEKEILEVFRKVEINIPLLDAIKQVPKYAKFLRDLCVNRRRLRGDERVIVGENVSAVLQRKLPPKCGDPGRFTVPCKIGNTLIRNTLLDLGASINVMPKSMYASLNLGPLKETEIIIQLADRTNAYPDGLVEDVLVKVNELIFPADFYVLDMDDDHSPDPSPLLLGRPFFSTAQTKIDVNKEFSEFACRDKFKLTENKYKGMKALYEVKRSRKLRKKAALKGYLDPGGGPPISRKIELHPD